MIAMATPGRVNLAFTMLMLYGPASVMACSWWGNAPGYARLALIRLLEGYNRGLGPIDPYLKDWEDPVGVYTDTGDYYYFVFDIRKSRMEKKPTFRIGDRNFYYRINSYHTVAAKVDPKTGNMIV
jgi:hypothetical protein